MQVDRERGEDEPTPYVNLRYCHFIYVLCNTPTIWTWRGPGYL